jgi:hypothetical protein
MVGSGWPDHAPGPEIIIRTGHAGHGAEAMAMIRPGRVQIIGRETDLQASTTAELFS